jgi:hypothetical protein
MLQPLTKLAARRFPIGKHGSADLRFEDIIALPSHGVEVKCGDTLLSDGRLIQILQTLALLLFLSVGVLSLARSRYPWAKWAKWGAVLTFSIAFLCALGITLRWAIGGAG